MAEKRYSNSVHDNDVIAFGDDTFKIGKFKKAVLECFGHDLGYGLISLLGNKGIKIDKTRISPDGEKEHYVKWFEDGIECEVLKTDDKGWHKAKVKINIELEFALNASESSMETAPPPLSLEDLDETDATIHADVWADESLQEA